MPANGPTIRGNPGPHITRDAIVYNSETGLHTREREYTGSLQGVAGLTNNFKANNREHRQDYENGMARVTVYDPIQGGPTLDKYEISWEMEQREIWSHPTVKEAAASFDATRSVGENSFRKIAEDAIDGPTEEAGSQAEALGAVFNVVLDHLRAGINQWEQEYIVLRRTRTVPPNVGVECNISAASLIYTTAQLLLPAVLFTVPSDAQIATFPNPDPDNFRWGWRRRPSTSTLQGQANEQTSEFLLAAWSLLFYEPATGPADW